MSDPLEAALLAAHEQGDKAALIGLYRQAAQTAETTARPEAAGFFLTQAYVFALETGDSCSAELREHLVRHGRET